MRRILIANAKRRDTYPCEIDLPWADVEVHEVVYNLALEEPLDIVDYNLFSHVDQLDKALAQVGDCLVIRNMVLNPAIKVVNGIPILPSNVL